MPAKKSQVYYPPKYQEDAPITIDELITTDFSHFFIEEKEPEPENSFLDSVMNMFSAQKEKPEPFTPVAYCNIKKCKNKIMNVYGRQYIFYDENGRVIPHEKIKPRERLTYTATTQKEIPIEHSNKKTNKRNCACGK